MKLRIGFVSNSSSSSYIIAIKKSKPCPHCHRSDINLIDLISESRGYDETSLEREGIDKVLKHKEEILKEYEYDEYESKTKVLILSKELEKYKGKEWSVAEISVSNHDTAIHEIMEQLKSLGSLVEIESEGH